MKIGAVVSWAGELNAEKFWGAVEVSPSVDAPSGAHPGSTPLAPGRVIASGAESELATKAKNSRRLVIVGLALMAIGVVDPMEGSLVILGGSLLVAVGAFLSRTRYALPITALVLIVVGVGAMFGMSALGGVGGNTGRSMWWLLLCVPYPIGWILGLLGAASILREPRNRGA